LVANGDKINARRMLSTTPTVDALINKEIFHYNIYHYFILLILFKSIKLT